MGHLIRMCTSQTQFYIALVLNFFFVALLLSEIELYGYTRKRKKIGIWYMLQSFHPMQFSLFLLGIRSKASCHKSKSKSTVANSRAIWIVLRTCTRWFEAGG